MLSADGHAIRKPKPIKNEYDGIYRTDMNIDIPTDGKWGPEPSKFRPGRELPKYV